MDSSFDCIDHQLTLLGAYTLLYCLQLHQNTSQEPLICGNNECMVEMLCMVYAASTIVIIDVFYLEP